MSESQTSSSLPVKRKSRDTTFCSLQKTHKVQLNNLRKIIKIVIKKSDIRGVHSARPISKYSP